MDHKTHTPFGRELTQGIFKCTDCGYIITEPSLKHLDACPMSKTKPHVINGWRVLSEVETMFASSAGGRDPNVGRKR